LDLEELGFQNPNSEILDFENKMKAFIIKRFKTRAESEAYRNLWNKQASSQEVNLRYRVLGKKGLRVVEEHFKRKPFN
jgi:hypothetical protein